MIITLKHCRDMKYCSRGIRLFFQRNNLDFSDFLKNGVEEEVFLKTNDSMAIAVVKKAKEDGNK